MHKPDLVTREQIKSLLDRYLDQERFEVPDGSPWTEKAMTYNARMGAMFDRFNQAIETHEMCRRAVESLYAS